jgi:hypothetical protein
MNIDNDHTIHHIRIVPHEEAIWAFEIMIGDKIHVLAPGDQKLVTLWQGGINFTYGFNEPEAVAAVGWSWFELVPTKEELPEGELEGDGEPMIPYFYSPLLVKAHIWTMDMDNWRSIKDGMMLYGPDVDLITSIDSKVWIKRRWSL